MQKSVTLFCPDAFRALLLEHWTGLGLDWIRIIAYFVEFGLDPSCKAFKKFGLGPDLD